MQRIALIFILLFGTSSVIAEIFTWVDENGQTHYSDKAPAKSEDVKTVKQQSINSMPVVKTNEAVSKALNDGAKAKPETRRLITRAPSKNSSPEDSCEQKKAIFKKSEECFAKCGFHMVKGGFNIGLCDCVAVKKPNC